MRSRPATVLSALSAVAVLALAAGPAGALAASPPGEGDMYQPWVPGEPEPKPKPKPNASQGNPAADPGYTQSPATDTVVIVGASTPTAPQPKVSGTARAKPRPVVEALPTARPSLKVDPDPAPGPSQAPAIAAMTLACLGCAWLLRPRRG
jgi:hypothetical protein